MSQNPNRAVSHYQRGNSLRAAGRLREAEANYQAALALEPDHCDARLNLGSLLQERGDLDMAMACHRRVVEVQPENAVAHYNIGYIHHSRGEREPAVAAYLRALECDPNLFQARCNLGGLYRDLGRFDEAILSNREILAHDPPPSVAHDAHVNLGMALMETRAFDEAVENFELGLTIDPNSVPARLCLAEAYENVNRTAEAETKIREALELDASNIEARRNLATLLRRKGQVLESIDLLSSIEIPADNPVVASSVHFELGRLYDRNKDPASAFHHFTLGNQYLRQAQEPRGARGANYLAHVRRCRTVLTRQRYESLSDSRRRDERSDPIFLVGFPRSGTTLLEQILGSHPEVQVLEEKPTVAAVRAAVDALPGGYPDALALLGDEELEALRRLYFECVDQHIVRKPGSVLVDKMPLNMVHAALIVRLFPAAKFVLTLRHSCDACLSCFMQPFEANDAMVNFYTLGDAMTLYDEVMRLWRQYVDFLPIDCHTIKYESVVDSFDVEIRWLLEYIGVGWHDAVKNFDERARNRSDRISTPSYEQVIQPIYRGAKGRWLSYEDKFLEEMGKLESHVRHFGYETPTIGT